jgi:hypothetical protein
MGVFLAMLVDLISLFYPFWYAFKEPVKLGSAAQSWRRFNPWCEPDWESRSSISV